MATFLIKFTLSSVDVLARIRKNVLSNSFVSTVDRAKSIISTNILLNHAIVTYLAIFQFLNLVYRGFEKKRLSFLDTSPSYISKLTELATCFVL
jgi:hypothetical protein